MEEIKVNLENLTEEERKLLMDLVKKGNEEKLKIKYPKNGTEYYYINYFGDYNNTIVCEHFYDYRSYNYEHGNFFLTYEKAKFEQEKQKVLFELKYWSNGYEYKYNEKNYYLFYNLNNEINLIVSLCFNIKDLNNIYFKSEEDALNAIKQVGEDRIKKYLFEIED